jgi:hypothetical protein
MTRAGRRARRSSAGLFEQFLRLPGEKREVGLRSPREIPDSGALQFVERIVDASALPIRRRVPQDVRVLQGPPECFGVGFGPHRIRAENGQAKQTDRSGHTVAVKIEVAPRGHPHGGRKIGLHPVEQIAE